MNSTSHNGLLLRGAILLLLAGLSTTTALAQTVSPVDSAYQRLSSEVDLAVPEYPAFALLQAHPSTVLRPSKLRDITVTVANVFLNGALPTSFAVEFAPYALATGNQSLVSYQNNHLINSLRVSLGTSSAAQGGTDVAAGIRFTPIDHGDPRMNQTFLSSLYAVADRINHLASSCLDTVLKQQGLTPLRYASLDAAQKGRIDSLTRICATSGGAGSVGLADLDAQIQTLRHNAEAELWNAEILDFGVAVKGHTPDSLVKEVYLDGYGFWGTYGTPLFGQNGQLLIGVRASSARTAAIDTFRTVDFSLGARLYLGSNALKGFAEYTAEGALPIDGGSSTGLTGSLQAGVEMKVMDGVWLEGAIGVRHIPGSPSEITDALNLRLAALP
jgi:hypothetical protein